MRDTKISVLGNSEKLLFSRPDCLKIMVYTIIFLIYDGIPKVLDNLDGKTLKCRFTGSIY